MLYVPVADYGPDSAELTIDFRRMVDGRTALIAFTALDRLIDGCGSAQPWVLVPTPAAAQALPTDGSATPRQVESYNIAVQAGQDHQVKVTAFTQAKDEAEQANGVLSEAKEVTKEIWADLTGKKYIHASDFTNGVGGHLIEIQKSTLKAEAKSLRGEVRGQLPQFSWRQRPGEAERGTALQQHDEGVGTRRRRR